MAALEPALFDFLLEVPDEIEHAAGGPNGPLRLDSRIMTFGESFFDQFFAAQGHEITGFSPVAQRRAVRFVEDLPDLGSAAPSVRRLVVAFEEFCELAKDMRGNYDDSHVRYSRALDLLDRLLTSAEEWAATSSTHPDQVVEAIRAARRAIGRFL